jgi:hypothetical protein
MKRTLVAALVATCTLTAILAPAVGAATVAAKWNANLGPNGTVTLSLFTSGTGSVVLALKGLPASTSVITSIKGGTCTTATSSVVTMPTYRSTSAGRLAKTKALSIAVMNKVQLAPTLTVRVKAGSWSKCAALRGGIPQAAGSFGPGIKLVGSDVKPGTYRIRVPAENCYWKRLSGLGGSIDEIIAGDLDDGYAVVTIAPTDVAFSSERCGTWSTDLSAVTKSRTAFGEGTFIVGTDMQPGRYRSSAAGENCYWKRLSGFGGSIDEIIAGDLLDGPVIVDIAPGDVGFYSGRCGDWTLVQ